jgi:hypothetical protein
LSCRHFTAIPTCGIKNLLAAFEIFTSSGGFTNNRTQGRGRRPIESRGPAKQGVDHNLLSQDWLDSGDGRTSLSPVRRRPLLHGPQVLFGGTVSTVGSDTVHQFLSGSSTLDLYSATIAGDIY